MEQSLNLNSPNTTETVANIFTLTNLMNSKTNHHYSVKEMQSYLKSKNIKFTTKTKKSELEKLIIDDYKSKIHPEIQQPILQTNHQEVQQSDHQEVQQPIHQETPSVEYKKKSIPKSVRTAVWEKYYYDKFYGKCVCCQKRISYEDYECSHIVPERFGGETVLHNLEPACRTCNRSMGTMNLNDFQKYFIQKSKVTMVDASTQTEYEEITIKIDQLKLV